MSSYCLPALPATDVVQVMGTGYKTSVYTSISQKEQRVAWGAVPVTGYKIRYNALRTGTAAPDESGTANHQNWSAYNEVSVIRYFHSYHQGSYEAFYIVDPYTGSLANVRFASDTLDMSKVCSGVWECELELRLVV